MTSYALIGGTILIAFSVTTDAKKTITFVTAIITIRGMSFIAKKITQSVNKDSSDLIDMAGWCLAGVPFVGLLKLAKQGFEPISGTIATVVNGFTSVAGGIEKAGAWMERFFG